MLFLAEMPHLFHFSENLLRVQMCIVWTICPKLICSFFRTTTMTTLNWGKFVLAFHDWNEPISDLKKIMEKQDIKLTTPLIGEPVVLDSVYPDKVWWNF